MKKILIISAVFPPEPVVSANLSFDLANALSERHAVMVINPAPSRPMGYDFSSVLPQQYPFIQITLNSYTHPESSLFGRFRESYSFGRACSEFITKNHDKVDLIYANIWPLFAQYFVVKALKKYYIPIILHVQDIYPESLATKLPWIGNLVNWLLRPLDSFVLHNASKVVAISDKMKHFLAKTRSIQSSHIEVVNNWQEEQPFIHFQKDNSLLVYNDTTFTFMYLGNIGPVAGCDLLIDAFAQTKNQNYRLIIAGSGSMKDSLEKYVINQKLKNIEFWHVPEGQVPYTQAQADILLIPIMKGAASTSIPSKLPAYMFSAKPIIATVDQDSDTANAIREAGCGWVLEPGNPVALAEKMYEVTAMPKDKLKEMGLKGREYALKHFTKSANLPRLVSIIEEALKA